MATFAAAAQPSHSIVFHPIDVAIIVGYVVMILAVGWALSKRASKDLDSYFLAGKSLPWWVIGTSHGASGFDITGTMFFVTMLFTYGVKAALIPWIWPLFDRIFRQVYLGAWIRRSNVLTGAEWMRTRFGRGLAGNLSHISVVVYALVLSVGFLCYAFQGVGKFAAVIFPWELHLGPLGVENSYAVLILLVTTAYLLLGGWYSVVLTDLVQFFLLTVASVFVAWVAIDKVSASQLQAAVPANWDSLLTGWDNWWANKPLALDWSGLVPGLNKEIEGGYGWLQFIVTIMFIKGILVSMAGPTPGYGMQHVLSTRNPREAALENWWMSVVQLVPRFLMITGAAVLGLVFFSPVINQMFAAGEKFDFEKILPAVISGYVPVGVVGILVAGLLAAFMSTFDSTVNSGAAYLVNDLYKRYIDRDRSPRFYVVMSYVASILLVAVAILIGMSVQSIKGITEWIAFALYGGYVAPNVLKWHWWRFNGHGYFAGMIAGVVAAIALQMTATINALAGTNYWTFPPLYSFFVTAPASLVASVVVCLVTPPESGEVLKSFYRDVRPWGFWRPVREALQAEDPTIEPNRDFRWDAFNVALGIVWQLQLMVAPICLVIRRWDTFWWSVAIFLVTSIIMKFTWYDRLERAPADLERAGRLVPAPQPGLALPGGPAAGTAGRQD